MADETKKADAQEKAECGSCAKELPEGEPTSVCPGCESMICGVCESLGCTCGAKPPNRSRP